MRLFTAFATAAALAALVGCTVHQTETPALSGPSDLALSMSVSSSPQTITQNGADASVITAKVFFTDPRTGQTTPKANLPIRFDMQVNGVTADYGTLSARSSVTGSDGIARTTYTAPPMPSGGVNGGGCNGVPGQCVNIVATTTDSSAASSAGATASGSATIALVPQGVILPPASTPTASFTVTPTPLSVGSAAIFDASASTPGTGATSITSYSWTFGDGSTGTGKTVSHTFNTAATFSVTLTVTNDRGLSASMTLQVTTTAVLSPSANFVFSPGSPSTGQLVVFNADTSTAATGHQLTTFNWNFGDGATASGLVVSHGFATAGAYSVTLNVADDLGQKNTKATTVTVTAGGGAGGGGQTQAAFSYSPLTPAAGQPIFFNAASSTAASGHTLTTYAWDFGDGTTFSGAVASASHSYAAAGTFSVTLTVTDDSGTKATVKTPITVAAASAGSLTAGFDFSPQNPTSGTLVTYNASLSSPISSITQYDWDFGDGTIVNNGGMIINHTYNNPNAGTTLNYVTRLTVHDGSGNAATTSKSIPVVAGADPVAAFVITSPNPATLAQANAGIAFDASASKDSGGTTNLTYQWDFGDGSALGSGKTPTHAYSARGTYTITLTVTQTTNGRTNNTSHTLIVQ
jgi:PKD repeat protein